MERIHHCGCTDRYEGFGNALKEVLGQRGKVVIDRLHVAQLYRLVSMVLDSNAAWPSML